MFGSPYRVIFLKLAALLFFMSNKSKRKNPNKRDNKRNWLLAGLIIIGILGASFLLAFLVSGLVPSEESMSDGRAQIISVKGNLMLDSPAGLFAAGRGTTTMVEEVRQAEENDNVDAIILDIDSPGGTPVASYELVKAIKDAQKPTVAVIRESGASGAYWVASSADHIISNELSITGSVGVLTSIVTFDGLLDDFNITYERIVGGDYKDIASPLKEMQPDERNELQRKIDLMHDFFVEDVTQNRNLTTEQREEVETGIFFIGLESIDVGLVDEFGGIREAEEYLSNVTKTNIEGFRIQRRQGFLDAFAGVFSSLSPKSMLERNENVASLR